MKCGWQKANSPSGSSKIRSAGLAQRAQDEGAHAEAAGCFLQSTIASCSGDRRREANCVTWSGQSVNRPAGVTTDSTRPDSQIAHTGFALEDAIEISAMATG